MLPLIRKFINIGRVAALLMNDVEMLALCETRDAIQRKTEIFFARALFPSAGEGERVSVVSGMRLPALKMQLLPLV